MQAQTTRDYTRHNRIVATAEAVALQVYRDRTDPLKSEIAQRVESKTGFNLNEHEVDVVWCAYCQKWADYECGAGGKDQ